MYVFFNKPFVVLKLDVRGEMLEVRKKKKDRSIDYVVSGKLILVLFLAFQFSCIKKTYTPASDKAEYVKITNSIKEDSVANATISPYRNKLSEQMSKVIGVSAQPLIKGDIEYNLGNFTADLIRTECEKLTGHPIDFAIMNHGGLRNTLPQGNITVGNIYELMPFDNELVVLTISSVTAKELFKFMARKKNIAVSNMKITISKDGYENVQINGKPFQEGQYYTLAISDYLANGGDDLGCLSNALKKEVTNQKIRDVIITHIENLTKQGKEIVAVTDGRVVWRE